MTRHGYGVPLQHTRLIEAGHPVPDEGSLRGAEAALAAAQSGRADDLVLVLLSGGASALCAAPVAGLMLADKRALTRTLLRCGATISQINCVRKHLSGFKGGRLAVAAAPARVVTLAISDVPGDAPMQSAPGQQRLTRRRWPTRARPSPNSRSRPIRPSHAALDDPANETPKPGDPAFANAEYMLAATAAQSLDAAAAEVLARGYRPDNLG